MRKFIILLFFALIISSTTDAKRISEPDEEIVPIIKTEGEDKKGNNPRTLLTSPIFCLYSNDSFIFSFYEMFESITIQIVNTSTGEQWSNYMEYSESSVRIPASTNSGIYNIFIYTEDGYYTGVFRK